MTTLRAGDLRNRLIIQRRLPGGSLGQPSKNWEEVAQVWSNVRFGSGSEAMRSGQSVSEVKCSIRIRWRTGITADMRAVSEGVIYEIEAVLPDSQRRQYIDLVCKVVGNGAR
ncbi:phage head closure protein [Comamonas antarctica]|uniref:phage head closure protein n=1 Tax=Comamonas antarctica TaxID=2743470 RepID=UPI0028E924BA|nr:phage head closure protein [Comamonas antarctica]